MAICGVFFTASAALVPPMEQACIRNALRMAQLALFADLNDGPQGLRYGPEFVSKSVEAELVERLQGLPLRPFQFGPYQGKRRIASFGFHYDFTLKRLQRAEPIPAWLAPIINLVEKFGELPAGSVGQVLCTEYEAGAGIGWHRDKPEFDKIFGLSLNATCKFRFRRHVSDRWQRFTLPAQPRSLYMMSGEARHGWQHSIPAVEERRYSITLRTMREDLV
jgi:alkylated DNA repair dioxygenase AlkB